MGAPRVLNDACDGRGRSVSVIEIAPRQFRVDARDRGAETSWTLHDAPSALMAFKAECRRLLIAA